MRKIIIISIVFLGTIGAKAQSVLSLDNDTKTVSVAQAGQYDRIEEVWKLEKGNSYLISLPALLDGYYFGPDAARRKVVSYEKIGDKYNVTTAEMEDLEDFLPNEIYLITPDIDVDKIVHITPGIKTSAEATPAEKELLHVEQDTKATGIRPLFVNGNKVNGTTCIYDIQGRKVSVMKKGETYIVNGKKVILN